MIYHRKPTTQDHVIDLAERLRESDRHELLASSGLEPLENMMLSLKLSTECWSEFADGKLMCIWGVVKDELALVLEALKLTLTV